MDFLQELFEVRFSIRQGDPLSIILYIIYVEPLLIALKISLLGSRVASVKQTNEAYCDDKNLLTDNLEDFSRMEDLLVKFDKSSGAILSRRSLKYCGLGDGQIKYIGQCKYVVNPEWKVE